MSDNGGCGAVVAVFSVGVVLAAALFIGAPVVTSGGLSWDNSTTIARTNAQLERERLRTQAETRQALEREETARIMSDNMRDTMQWLVAGAVVVGGIALIGWTVQRGVSAWAARPHRPVAPAPSQVIVMLAAPELAAAPEAYLGYNEDNDTWAVVNPRTGSVKLLEDHPPPRQIAQRRG